MLRPTALNPARNLGALALILGLASTIAGAASPASAAVERAAAPAARLADDAGGVTFATAPAGENGPDGRSRFQYEVEPGTSVSDHMYVQNLGTEAATFQLYATDAYNNDDGAFALLTADQTPVDAGSWVTFPQACVEGTGTAEVPCQPGPRQSVTVNPGTTAVVPFTVTVPADASPGDHAGGVIASYSSGEGQVTVQNRLATRLYVRASGELQPLISIGGLRTSYHSGLDPRDGSLDITYTLTNTGNVALRGTISSWVDSSLGGGRVATADALQTEELLPGQNRTLSLSLDGVEQVGLLAAHVRLDPFVDPGSLNPGPIHASTRDATVWALPWVGLIALALIAIGLVVWLFLRRRRRARIRREVEAGVAAALAAREQSPDGLVGSPAGGDGRPESPADPRP